MNKNNTMDENTAMEKNELSEPAPPTPTSAFQSLGWLDRLLAVWILLAMIVGVLLGNFVPQTGTALKKGTFVGVSVPIAVGLLVMMYPILCKVRYESLHKMATERGLWKQLAFSVGINWVATPLLMLALAWAFLPDKSGLREGLVLVGLGRCIAMVLVWTSLAGGHVEYCALLVAVNSLLQMVLFAPLALLFLRVISRDRSTTVSYAVVATSVAVFLGIPLGAAVVTRVSLRATAGPAWFERVFLPALAPWSLIGLLYTILVLFASQGHAVVHQIVSVVRVAAPLIVYFVVAFFLTLAAARRLLGVRYDLAVVQSFTAASNNFELAIAVAVATFGADSDQALAATVGPLIEVPVLLGLVYVVRWMGRRWEADASRVEV